MSDPTRTTPDTPEEAAGRKPAAAPDPTPAPDAPVEEILDGVPAEESETTGDEADEDEEGDGDAVHADLKALVAKASERDQYLALAQRTQADFENYRRRMATENARAGDRGVAKLASELLPALDHFDLAVKAAEGHADVVKGFAIIRDEIVGALARVGIQPFSPAGETFDPNEHEAMVSQPAEGAESGTVLEVYQSGYRINGSVLRPARVVVAA